MVKKYKVLHDRYFGDQCYAKAGDVVYDQMSYDYGLANDDSRMTGIEHTTVTKNADGSTPGFTIPKDFLKEIKD